VPVTCDCVKNGVSGSHDLTTFHTKALWNTQVGGRVPVTCDCVKNEIGGSHDLTTFYTKAHCNT